MIGLTSAAQTDVGKCRSHNEDAFYADEKDGLFIIADGMGGHLGGEVASAMAIKEISGSLRRAGPSVSIDHLRQAVEAANEAIFQRSVKDPALYRMGTTIVIAIIVNGGVLLAHVGDSRAYHLTHSGLVRVTDDHSLVFRLLAEGKITPEEAKQHPHRSALLRAVGVDKTVQVDCRELKRLDTMLLLCTDGLTEMLDDHEIEEKLRAQPDPQKVCDALVNEANQKGGKDNITVIVVRRDDDTSVTGVKPDIGAR